MRISDTWFADEKTPHPSTNNRPQSGQHRSLAQRVLHSLKAWLLDVEEFQVWRSVDAEGQLVWNVRDRIMGESLQFVSEEALLTWIEQRSYYAPSERSWLPQPPFAPRSDFQADSPKLMDIHAW